MLCLTLKDTTKEVSAATEKKTHKSDDGESDDDHLTDQDESGPKPKWKKSPVSSIINDTFILALQNSNDQVHRHICLRALEYVKLACRATT